MNPKYMTICATKPIQIVKRKLLDWLFFLSSQAKVVVLVQSVPFRFFSIRFARAFSHVSNFIYINVLHFPNVYAHVINGALGMLAMKQNYLSVFKLEFVQVAFTHSSTASIISS
ncbi:hypothetical protein OAN307_c28930 [Octadecabacter antarcticus 307]|uniref:Uncharacterized protein n=1 Tax=Octadecabacter antarcticus 307 TaxID=391626 RepID=M9RDL1_9RHOB|nr:hypothetical protein OAN307_c28930 [Octadecabacter antarcticus 307]